MGFMDIVGGIADFLQKPQSIATGLVAGLEHQLNPDTGRMADFRSNKAWIEDLQRQGFNTVELEKRLFGDPNSYGNIGDIGSGLKAGLGGHLTPAGMLRDTEMETRGKVDDSILAKLASTAVDLTADPLIFGGVVAKGASAAGKLGKAGRLADAALSAGKLGEDATRAERIATAAARAARRTYQGTVATGDPLSGFAAGQILGLGENAMARAFPRAFGRVARNLDTEGAAVPSAVQTAPGASAPQGSGTGFALGELGPGRVRGQSYMPPVSGPIEGQLPIRGELGGRTVLDLPSGPRPVGELMPATARVGAPGPRPMGPIPEFADVSIPRGQPSFMDQLVQDAVAKAVPKPAGGVGLGGPANVNEIMIDPTLTGAARDEYLLNALEQLLRRTG